MLILGLDQSVRRSGWALYESPGDERKIRTGSFGAPATMHDSEELCDFFGLALWRLVGRVRPGFICWERASRRITNYAKKSASSLYHEHENPHGGWTVNADQLLLPEIQGQIRQIAIDYGIPYESVPTGTWRADLFGTGGGSLSRKEAKAKAKQYCRWLGIPFDGEDEAEAACIARWAATCSQKLKFKRWVKDVEQEAVRA